MVENSSDDSAVSVFQLLTAQLFIWLVA